MIPRSRPHHAQGLALLMCVHSHLSSANPLAVFNPLAGLCLCQPEQPGLKCPASLPAKLAYMCMCCLMSWSPGRYINTTP